ncbi:WD40 repeat-like protein [Myriangium duriaei CBS 260.36]|uniref:WD40 repeat-like protein n=1 Tax=Myriangium duriaei CBS 260.36 TaxID=1168546 RepID=A0A9P4IZ44_9PEZI|nr:WD40 repeat-like protein [Myriangium duriaei CBS 260.36]
MSINYITFNQDHTFLAVATTDGFRIYSTDPFSLVFQTPLAENGAAGDISVLEMLFSTSLVAMILSPRLLRIINTKRQSTICELTFPSRVGALRLNRKRLVVVLEDIIFIYDIQTMKTLHQIVTPTNPYSLCALSPNPENNYIAYPIRKQDQPTAGTPSHVPPSAQQKGPEVMSGDVMLFDANELQEIKVIPAHQAPLSCMAINSDGTLLATASEKGTVIRVFELPSAKKLYQFRRGSMPARIYCMSFNATSTLLCVSSATETIHIFKLSPQTATGTNGGSDNYPQSPSSERGFDTRGRGESPGAMSDQNASTDLESSTGETNSTNKPRNPGFMSLMRRTSQNVSSTFVSRAAGYLPSAVTEIWEPSRDFAWVKVPRSRSGQMVKSVVAMAGGMPQVMVATSEGEYLVYNVDLEKGGEGTLVRQYSVKEKNDNQAGMYGE